MSGCLIFVLFLFFSNLCAQEIDSQRKKYVVNPSSPSVYIDQEKNKSGPKEDEDRTFFRLFNNLKWPIRLTVSTAGKGEGDVQLDYQLLNSKDDITGGYRCHVCTIIPLSSGKNLSFSVPTTEFEKNLRIRVEYSFWWESSRDVGTENEPFHYILFTFR